MRTVMTEEEVAAASKLDDLAKIEAGDLASGFERFDPLVVDTARLFVCELAFQQYQTFAEKFDSGNSAALREMLDECWRCNSEGAQLPSVEQIRLWLDRAEIDEEDWDHPSAGDAGAALCAIDACLAYPGTDRIDALRTGLESLLLHSVKRTIDEQVETGGAVEELLHQVQSQNQTVSPFLSQQVRTVLEAAQRFSGNRLALIEWTQNFLRSESR